MGGDVYEGNDRIRQICWLQNLAANIAFGSDDPSTPARERVDYYCTHFPEELPPWFNDHDQDLLVGMVATTPEPEARIYCQNCALFTLDVPDDEPNKPIFFKPGIHGLCRGAPGHPRHIEHRDSLRCVWFVSQEEA